MWILSKIRAQWCKWHGHNFIPVTGGRLHCIRCGHVLPSRSEILNDLLSGIETLFGMKYRKVDKE